MDNTQLIPEETPLKNKTSRLKKLCEIPDSQVYTYEDELIEQEREAISGKPIKISPLKAKKSQKKAKAPKLIKLNSLCDQPVFSFDDEVVEHEFLRNEELQFPSRDRPANRLNSFLLKCKQQRPDIMTSTLTLGVIKDNFTEGDIEIRQPLAVSGSGFMLRRQGSNQRDLLREQLKQTINQRKTAHITHDLIFNKTKTELEGKKKREEVDDDSDYIPDLEGEDEEQQANELQRMIDLEEGLEEEEPEDKPNDKVESYVSSETEDNDTEVDATETEEESLSTPAQEPTPDDMELDFPYSKTKIPQISSPSISSTQESSTITPQISRPIIRVSARPFLDDQAELGSDNEEHDDARKAYSDDEEDFNDGELEELLDRGDIDAKEKKLMRKFMSTQIAQDHFQLQKVINGDFASKRRGTNYLEDFEGVTSKKMKLMKQRAEQLQDREEAVFSLQRSRSSFDEDGEEYEEYRIPGNRVNRFKELYNMGSMLIDDGSQAFLSMVEKPEPCFASKSLIGVDSNSSTRVLSDRSNSISFAKGYIFGKENVKPKVSPIRLKRNQGGLSKML